MKLIQWDIVTPDGLLRIEKEFSITSICLDDRLLVKKCNWWGSRRRYQCKADGVSYEILFRGSVNVLRNFGLKCFVVRNGEMIAKNPDHSGIYIRNYLKYLLASAALGLLLGVILILIDI